MNKVSRRPYVIQVVELRHGGRPFEELVRERRREGKSFREIAREFDISHQVVWRYSGETREARDPVAV